MAAIDAVIFDIGRVLVQWDPALAYTRLIPDAEERATFLREVVTSEWHFQHDQGRPFAHTSAELTARFPQHAELIAAWAPNFLDTIPGPVEGMPELVAALDAAGVPIYALTNFSHEFFPPFRARYAALFAPFRDILVSGEERLVKPDAAIYRLALERWGLEPRRTLFVDDVPANVEGARAVGMRAMVFRDAPMLRAELVTLGLLGGATARA